MSDGYEPWIAIAPEGKVPVRAGTADDPTKYADAWADPARRRGHEGPAVGLLRARGARGADRRSRPNSPDGRIPQGQGDLLGAIQGEQPVAKAVNEVDQRDDAEEAATAGRRGRARRSRSRCSDAPDLVRRRHRPRAERASPAAPRGAPGPPARARTRAPGWR